MNEAGRSAKPAPRRVLDRFRRTATLLVGALLLQGVCTVSSAAQDPVWSLTAGVGEIVPERLVVVGVDKNGKFVPTEIIPPSQTGGEHGTRPFPLEANLLEILEARAFGSEERVATSRKGETLIVRCRAGEQPAGVILAGPDFRFPHAMRGKLIVEGRGSVGFGFALTEAGRDAPENRIESGAAEILASIPSSEWPKGTSPRQLVVTCPKYMAETSIAAVRLVPQGQAGLPRIGTWVWDIRPWIDHPEQLRDAATWDHVGDIFLQLPIHGGSVVGSARLRRLIDVLSSSGIAVHAVEGDPDMASAEGRPNALDRARILHRFQQAGTRLQSFQYDIEPYLRPGYRADPAAAWREWAASINELSAVVGGRISVVVPFWMLGDPAAEPALLEARSSISGITVMAYRTDVSVIEQITSDWLDWGADQGIRISIALENGPLPPEMHRTYVRAERGDLVLDRSGSLGVAQLMPAIVTGTLTKPTYSYSHEGAVDTSRISFLGNRKAMEAAIARLNRNLGAWPSFGGMLVHELIGPRGEGMEMQNRSGAGEWNETKNPDLRR